MGNIVFPFLPDEDLIEESCYSSKRKLQARTIGAIFSNKTIAKSPYFNRSGYEAHERKSCNKSSDREKITKMMNFLQNHERWKR